MEFSPEKPHFFKPILPGFKNGLKIPIGFLKHLKEHEHEHAILRRGGNKWLVKLNGRRLEEGWQNFAEENGLQLGDFLVFKHEGDMEFEVFIFDSSQCERVNGWPQHVVHEREELAKEKPKSNIKTSSGKAFPKVEGAYKDMHLTHPHFICTIRPYSLSRHFLSVPAPFARENRLNNRKCEIILRDERRTWTCNMYPCETQTYIGCGWREFCIANCLKEGDRLIFEIVSNGEKPIFRFYDLRGSPSLQLELKKNNLDDRITYKGLHFQEKKTDLRKTSNVTAPKLQVPALTSADDANPHFVSTIKPHTIKKSVLYLPLPFAKSNGSINRCCEMILIDEKRRSWSVQIGPMAPHFGIKSGLREFIKANNVQAGDTYKFELINNGTPPIAYFHCKYSGKDDNDHKLNCQDNEAVGDGQGKED